MLKIENLNGRMCCTTSFIQIMDVIFHYNPSISQIFENSSRLFKRIHNILATRKIKKNENIYSHLTNNIKDKISTGHYDISEILIQFEREFKLSFPIETKEILKCQLCLKESYKFVDDWPFFLLQISNEKCSLKECFDDYFAQVEVDIECDCNVTSKKYKNVVLNKQAPDILLFQLSRTQKEEKILNNEIKCDFQSNFFGETYELIATCNRFEFQKALTGHYITHVKYSDKFFRINDENICEINSEDIFGGVYLFVFQKKKYDYLKIIPEIIPNLKINDKTNCNLENSENEPNKQIVTLKKKVETLEKQVETLKKQVATLEKKGNFFLSHNYSTENLCSSPNVNSFPPRNFSDESTNYDLSPNIFSSLYNENIFIPPHNNSDSPHHDNNYSPHHDNSYSPHHDNGSLTPENMYFNSGTNIEQNDLFFGTRNLKLFLLYFIIIF